MPQTFCPLSRVTLDSREGPFSGDRLLNRPPLLFCRDPDALTYAIKRSCEDKADVVAADEKEAGLRATLNLGHTFGHVGAPQPFLFSGLLLASRLFLLVGAFRRGDAGLIEVNECRVCRKLREAPLKLVKECFS